jgi:hypothetical protein
MFYLSFVCYAVLVTKLTPRSRVLPEKLTGPQLLKKFPEFYENRRFVITFTTARHTCPCPEPDQSTPCPHPTTLRSILISSSHLRLGLPSGLIPSDFPTKTQYAPFPSPYVLRALPISVFLISGSLSPRHGVS